jgi:hypothetical protein
VSFVADFLSFLNGFRKFVIMILLIIIGVVFRLFDYIDGAEFVDLLKHTAIAYMSFNGLEHVTNLAKSAIEKKNKKQEDK